MGSFSKSFQKKLSMNENIRTIWCKQSKDKSQFKIHTYEQSD